MANETTGPPVVTTMVPPKVAFVGAWVMVGLVAREPSVIEQIRRGQDFCVQMIAHATVTALATAPFENPSVGEQNRRCCGQYAASASS